MEKGMIWTYIISNLLGILFILAAIYWKRAARVLYAMLFMASAWAAWRMSYDEPADYLLYTKYAIGFYQSSIHQPVLKIILAIAQVIISIGILYRGSFFRFACLAGCIMLAAISPFGLGVDFPASLLFSGGMILLFRSDHNKRKQ